MSEFVNPAHALNFLSTSRPSAVNMITGMFFVLAWVFMILHTSRPLFPGITRSGRTRSGGNVTSSSARLACYFSSARRTRKRRDLSPRTSFAFTWQSRIMLQAIWRILRASSIDSGQYVIEIRPVAIYVISEYRISAEICEL